MKKENFVSLGSFDSNGLVEDLTKDLILFSLFCDIIEQFSKNKLFKVLPESVRIKILSKVARALGVF